MARVPLIGRLSPREYIALVFGVLFVLAESSLRLIIVFLPKPVLDWFYDKSRAIFRLAVPPRSSSGHSRFKSKSKQRADKILKARDFEELCGIFGYTHEEHVCLTKDGYLLGLHRLPSKKGLQKSNPGTSTGKPVVYLHHGLLMNSEIWVCMTEAERCLPFVLVEEGYDVWLGNNRGNKYSKKSDSLSPNTSKFWDFSIDDFAWHDIPDSIHYILDITKAKTLSYIGFSQGTAQAFAALSIHPQLNEKINVFIALAPAMSPPGLSAPIIDALMKTSPTLLYLVFGRKSILSSALSWQSLLYPPIFSSVIDTALGFLFNWQSANISPEQKVAAYAHLYSYTSVKAVVHWFQIMRSGEFVMFDDDAGGLLPSPSPSDRRGRLAYRPARFPTRNIVTPIVLLWGDTDSLVNIDVMLSQLPGVKGRVTEKRLRGYEHLDVLWGKNVHVDVIPEVLSSLKLHREAAEIEEKEAEEEDEEEVKVEGATGEEGGSTAVEGEGTDFTD